MDFSILYAIQKIRTDLLDNFILGLTKIAGSYGQVWVVIAVLLLIFKKTRKAGISVLIGYALVFLLGHKVLKDLIARVRPCNIDTAIEMLISRPSSYSCPSTHSAWAFAGATAILMENRKIGIPALILAVLIAFSRLYLFVHFPSDVLFGAVLGAAFGIVSVLAVRTLWKRIFREKA